MNTTLAEQNTRLVLSAFDTLFNRRDYDAASTMWSEDYIQHSTHIAPSRAGLFDRARSRTDESKSGLPMIGTRFFVG
jgi:predicted SnoaL-like aldol condensation-catalyzing enzyme